MNKHSIDQDAVRRALRQQELDEQFSQLGVTGALLDEYTALIHEGRDAREDDLMREIGILLAQHGHWPLWLLVYHTWCRHQERSFILGDEFLFLLHKPVSDQVGYAGPPPAGSRLNSALEAAQQTKHTE